MISRKGENVIGLHFVARDSVYYGRGLVEKIEMMGNGPKKFALLFNEKEVAHTDNGTITLKNFHAHSKPQSVKGDFLMKGVDRVTIRADTCPPRQNYYVTQRWTQQFQQQGEHLVPYPCISMYNLLEVDDTAKNITTLT